MLTSQTPDGPFRGPVSTQDPPGQPLYRRVRAAVGKSVWVTGWTCLTVYVLMAGVVGAQDTNTLLSVFLRNLRAGVVSVGAVPATAGTWRLPTLFTVQFRNAANTDDAVALQGDASDNLVLAGTNVGSVLPGVDNTRQFGSAAARWQGLYATEHIIPGLNGQLLTIQQATELTTIAAAASTDTTITMPANSVVLGVSVRVTTVIPTAATFTVGDSGSATRFSTAAVSVAAGSTDPGTKAGAYYNASALSVRITPDVSPASNTGRVRVTIYYYTVTVPTS